MTSKGYNSQMERVSDAPANNFVYKFSPAWALPYLQIARWDRPIGTWLLLIPCWWGLFLATTSSGQFSIHDIWLFVAFGIGALLMRGAGCTWNDLMDHKMDAQVERTKSRPLPSGRISRKNALIWLVMQSLSAALILLSFNTYSIILGLLSIVPATIYPFAKRFTWWPQFFLGVAFNWGALLGWSAHTGSLGLPPIILYISGIFWTLFYDTIYSHQDTTDDKLTGIKSTGLLFGKKTKEWLVYFLLGSLLCITFAVGIVLFANGGGTRITLAFTSIALFGFHMIWQINRLELDSPEVCLKLFRSNRDAGLIIVAGLLLTSFV
ncbi:MAG: 4-hydroxybenzoate octaprenyltransferase [Rhodobacteraceae bacterium]|nr:4-hydroxybenzoate octaprenyltransferase [Paracoccaceae bacterium]